MIHLSIIRPVANRFITEDVERLHGKPYESFHPAVRDLLLGIKNGIGRFYCKAVFDSSAYDAHRTRVCDLC